MGVAHRIASHRIASGGGGPSGHRLVIRSGEDVVSIEDVLVGEVWFAAGQSNMMWKLDRSDHPEESIASADHPLIRMFHSPEVTAEPPQEDIAGQWTVCSPETAGNYSAVAYYYARKLQQELGVPGGVIVSAWGAKRVESFISREVLQSDPVTMHLVDTLMRQEAHYDPAQAMAVYEQRNAAFQQWVDDGQPTDRPRPRPMREEPQRPLLTASQPGVRFNSMVHPFVGYDIQGVIWYQGESNAHTHLVPYAILLSALIQDWRSRWGYEFPFYYVQLANFKAPTSEPVVEDPWAAVQDRMRRVLATTAHTGMAVINDGGEENNIHPKDKQTPGERLARWAFAHVYDAKDVIYSGPLYESFEVEAGALMVRFTRVGLGLQSRDGLALQRFEIAGSDGKWIWANAEIVGGAHVNLSHPEVTEPVAARYAWSSNPEGANLVNRAGLPTSVFSTED
jgi:sialate O-acetylesterase